MNDDKTKNILENDVIAQIELNEQPLFGKSLAGGASVSRFASNLGVRNNSPRVVEVIGKDVKAGEFTHFFTTLFQRIPFIQGTLRAGGRVFKFQVLNVAGSSVTKTKLVTNIPTAGYLHLRIYQLPEEV